MRTPEQYLELITSQHNQKPRFVSTVAVTASILVQLQEVFAGFLKDFDIDHAVGTQEDQIGEWVGISRNLDVPLTGVYFTWDDTQFDGWDSGTWISPTDPESGLVKLPDDEYRILLKAKIAANSWDGTIPGAYEVWETIFEDVTILIQDNQDMTMAVGIVGGGMSAIAKELLVGGYIPLKPSGVAITYYALVNNPDSMLLWDSSEGSNGWDSGSWAEILTPT